MTDKEAKDQAYQERDRLVAALSKIFPAWLGYHKEKDWEDDWRNIVYIKIPVLRIMKGVPGIPEFVEWKQVSWHIHDSEMDQFRHLDPGLEEWDGHSTEEKYNRLASLHIKKKISK